MKSVAFYAFTPFQVITALAIKRVYFNDWNADIILEDSVVERDHLRDNIQDYRIFENVYYTNRGACFNKYGNRFKHEWFRFLSTVKPGVLTGKDAYINNRYDVFISTEIDYWTESIYYNLRRVNPGIEVSLMDEGYSSYTYFFREKYKPIILKNRLKKLPLDICCALGLRYSIPRDAKKLYLFEPDLNCWDEVPYELKGIDVKNNDSFVNTVNQAFGFPENFATSIEDFRLPYIYFEESFFWMNRNSNDQGIISNIADIVGKENMIIKLHPRNQINRFKEFGFKTNKTVGVPWELFAINSTSEDTTYITFSSGAVLNYKFLVSKAMRTILLYKCIGDQFYHVDPSVKLWFEKFSNKYPEMLFIPEKEEELYAYLKQNAPVGARESV